MHVVLDGSRRGVHVSINFDTVASERVNGRCVDCGRFLSRHDVHFHGPKRKFRGRPRAHIYLYGDGGLVTRCDDVEQARDLLIRKLVYQGYDRDEAEEMVDVDRLRISRGRIMVQTPESEYSWLWYPESADAVGLGITTAVEWAP